MSLLQQEVFGLYVLSSLCCGLCGWHIKIAELNIFFHRKTVEVRRDRIHYKQTAIQAIQKQTAFIS